MNTLMAVLLCMQKGVNSSPSPSHRGGPRIREAKVWGVERRYRKGWGFQYHLSFRYFPFSLSTRAYVPFQRDYSPELSRVSASNLQLMD